MEIKKVWITLLFVYTSDNFLSWKTLENKKKNIYTCVLIYFYFYSYVYFITSMIFDMQLLSC